MDNQNVYLQSLEIKKKEVDARHLEYERELAGLEASNAEYKQAVSELSKIGSKLITATISGDTKEIERLKIDSVKYSALKKEIEKRAGIEPIKYLCDLCKDTGYVNGKICSCVKKIASDMLIKSASKIAPVANSRFSTFDLDFYETELPDGTNPKKRMTAVLKALKEYAINFNPRTSESMIFFGNTGLGKTHLSLAIMNELIEKGYFVHYDSAFNLFSRIETEHFKNHTDDTYNESVSCDLLIIDDLGSEFSSSYTQSAFYSILNTRLLAGKPTIINTNLSMLEIENRYTPRVSSRIVGEFTAKKFIGNDIRQKKIMKNK